MLSIDGGGPRSHTRIGDCLPRKKSGKPAGDVGLMVGTSTGGMLALGLALQSKDGEPRFRARQMVKLYGVHGEEIFEQSLWRKLRSVGGIFEEAYSHEALEKILKKYFEDHTLADCGVPPMVTSYDIQNRRTVFLKSWHEEHAQLLCSEAARATSAAPT